MLQVGFIDYLHSFPLTAAFRLSILEPDYCFHYGSPNQLNYLLRTGVLDVSQVSSFEYLEEKPILLPRFGISAHSKIQSVNFYYKGSLNNLSEQPIGLTVESTTSAMLLKILCHHVWKIEPKFEVLNKKTLDHYQGILLIGDEALAHPSLPSYHYMDLAEEWNKATGLPFVFALFVANRQRWEQKKEEIETFEKYLEASLNWGENNPDEVLSIARKRTCCSIAQLKEYYRLCHYRLGKKELEGLATFEKMKNDVP